MSQVPRAIDKGIFAVHNLASGKLRKISVALYLVAQMVSGSFCATAQINAYARVTNISGGGTRLSLTDVNQTYHNFNAGEKVVVMQMQGVSASTNNNANFGNLNALNAAGLYEVAVIDAVNGSATSMTLTFPLVNNYSTSGRVQVISFRKLGTGSYTTTGNITGIGWNDDRGGVVALHVSGNLYLNHSINANYIGFRGGDKAGQDGGGCEDNVWRTNGGNNKYAEKGESVYRIANNRRAGKGKSVNGGGGGIVHNGGGGGGGNYTAGGDGYYGYTGGGYCSAGQNAGGQGGLPLSSNWGRVFAGGGGGGGQENDGLGSDGGDGGGIVLIKCDSIIVQGPCGARSISANGETAVSSGNDGAGGGGGGGSIVLDINGIRVNGGCALTISANGGNGGDVNNGSSHGAGGGGGQGALFIRAAGPFPNTQLQTNNGSGGDANTNWNSPNAESGSGSSGAGVSTGVSAIMLPVEMLSLDAFVIRNDLVEVRWVTMTELDNSRFEVLHSIDGGTWHHIGTLQGAGTHYEKHSYTFEHRFPAKGMNYYKLKQIDRSGNFKISALVYAMVAVQPFSPELHPNPCTGRLTVESPRQIDPLTLQVHDVTGRAVAVKVEVESSTKVSVYFLNNADGIYFLTCGEFRRKVILQR